MDFRRRKRDERREERHAFLRRAVEQLRAAPVPADALEQALERARAIRSPVNVWLRWLIRGAAGRN